MTLSQAGQTAALPDASAGASFPPPGTLDAFVPQAPTVPVLPPVMPRLQQAPPTAGPAPQTPARPLQPHVPMAVVSPKRKGPSFGRRLARALVWLMVLGLLGGAAFGGYRLVLRQNASDGDSLPTFPDATLPTYESGTFRFEVTLDGVDDTMNIVLDVDAGVFEARLVNDDVHMISDGALVYVELDDGTWTSLPTTGDIAVFGDLADKLRPHTFDEMVPPGMRDHLTIREEGDAVVEGRPVHRYALLVDFDRFRDREPAEFAIWSKMYGADEELPSLGLLEVYVDEAGVVWKYGSYADLSSDRESVTIIELSPTEIEIAIPVTVPIG